MRISDEIFEDAYKETINENDIMRKSASIEKESFDLSINPASIVGALTGAAIAGNRMQSNIMQRQIENDNSTVLSGNYYSQVQNLASNLKIIFTPFGVVFIVKNGAKEITIETMETEEMNTSMFSAWQQKDAQYFKTLILNKMYNEIQFIEQQFAKNIIQQQLGIQKKINKHASIDVDVDDLSINEMVEYIASTKDLYAKQTEVTEKLAGVILDTLDCMDYAIDFTFQRPLDKYAFLGNPLSFLGLDLNSKDLRSLQGSYLSPMYLSNKVKIGFLPDRVLFVVDNKVITSLLAMDMNAEAFDNFEKQNETFFTNYFSNQARKGISRMKGKIPPPKSALEKMASLNIADIFTENDIHPAVYFCLLNNKYGNIWIDWDAHILVKTLEDDFGLVDGLNDIPLNKILCVQTANNNQYPYTNAHVFEKVIRAFNDKPIDFLKKENSITLYELAFGIDALDMITPEENIYSNFSAEVFKYIIDTLVEDGAKLFIPSEILHSEKEQNFYEQLNKYLLDAVNAKDTANVMNDAIESDSIHINESSIGIASAILEHIRKNPEETNKIIDTTLGAMDIPGNIKNIARMQVLNNITVDRLLVMKKEQLKQQLTTFNIV